MFLCTFLFLQYQHFRLCLVFSGSKYGNEWSHVLHSSYFHISWCIVLMHFWRLSHRIWSISSFLSQSADLSNLPHASFSWTEWPWGFSQWVYSVFLRLIKYYNSTYITHWDFSVKYRLRSYLFRWCMGFLNTDQCTTCTIIHNPSWRCYECKKKKHNSRGLEKSFIRLTHSSINE